MDDHQETLSSRSQTANYRKSLLKNVSEGFQLFIEECADPFFVHDIEGNIFEVNRKACESLGYTRAELLELNVKDIESGFDVAALRKIWPVIVPGQTTSVDGRHTRKDGVSFPVEVRIAKLSAHNEMLLVAVARDCTERKQQEAELKNLNNILSKSIETERKLTERLTMRFSVTNVLAGAKSIKEAAPNLLQLMAQGDWDYAYMCVIDQWSHLIHRSFSRLEQNSEIERLEELLKPQVQNKTGSVSGRVWSEGRAQWLENLQPDAECTDVRHAQSHGARTMLVFPITGEGSTVGIFCLLSRTALKFNEDTLNLFVSIGSQVGQFQERKLAQDIAREVIIMKQRDDFMSMLTHDLKTPLLGANRILDLLTNDAAGSLSDEQKKILKQLQNSNAELVSMVQDLISVYRYERELSEIKFRETDLSALVEKSIATLKHVADAKQIEVVCELPAEPIKADVEADSISRLVQNLLDNALKFTPKRGKVRVTLTKGDANECILEVSDTGVGLSEEECASLFTRFWQGVMGKKYSASVGLGLYLCKQIVDAHGGTIDCKSKLEEGSIFTVRLLLVQVRVF